MKVYSEIINPGGPTAIALGFFDGVHKGHQKIISKTANFKKIGLIPCVFTFTDNPKNVLDNQHIEYITSNKQKISKIGDLKIQALYMINFKNIKDISPEEFIYNILVNKLNAKILVCGNNYHFGKGGNSTAYDLKKIAGKHGVYTYIEDLVTYNDLPISSTRIRTAIKNSDIEFLSNTL